MYTQTNAGLLCCVGPGSSVAVPLDLLSVPPALTFRNSVFCPTMHLCFARISEQTAIISLYRINWLVFITEAETVSCAVRSGSLYQTCPLKD